MKNEILHLAKKNKKDEFYTMYEDIEKEMIYYKIFLKNKIVYCNCDDYRTSNFYKYFKDNFKELKLKSLYASCYIEGENGVAVVYNGREEKEVILKGDGDFKSKECIKALKRSDIIITNPPFSLFRDFIDTLIEYDKDFIILGNMNAITYKNIFPSIKNNKIFLGIDFNKSMYFKVPSDYNTGKEKYINGMKVAKVPCIAWYTTFNIKENDFIDLTEKYTPEKYSKYDNYDAISVDKVKDIPKDYYGEIGVPITFLGKYNSKQFKIIGHEHDINGNGGEGIKEGEFRLKGKGKYKRIIIQRVKEIE